MGGAEIFIKEIAQRLVKAGHEVTLFTSKFRDCNNEEIIDGIRVIRAGGKYSVYWKAKEYYKHHLSNEVFDIVIDEINTRPFLTPKFVNRGERIIALIHQLAREYWFYETSFPLNYIGYYYLENRWLRNYTDVYTITVSESTKSDLLNLGFSKVFIVSEGINFTPLDAVPQKEIHPVIAYVGRLTKAKRPDHAIKAFKFIKDEFPKAELWIMGEGYFRKDLEGIAINGVKFLGNLPNEDRRNLLKKAWVLVNPSIREGYGLNIVEANALGIPCIAYNVPGLRDSIQNEKTGLLVESGTIRSLVDYLLKVVKDESLREMLSENALKYSRAFNWDKSARELEKGIWEAIRS